MQKWPATNFNIGEYAPYMRLLLPLVAGIISYRYLPFTGSSPLILLLLGLAPAIALIISALGRRFTTTSKVVFPIALHLFLLWAGYASCYYQDAANSPNNISAHTGTGGTWCVRIASTPTVGPRSIRLMVEVLSQSTKSTIEFQSGKAYIYLPVNERPLLLLPGDTLIVRDNWAKISNNGNPFEIDYGAYCRINGITHRQWCSYNDVILVAHASEQSFPVWSRFHYRCMAIIKNYLQDRPASGLLQAMLLGNEANLDTDMRNTFTATGIVHIIAISGGNVAILFTIICYLLWWIRHNKYWPIKLAIAAIPICFYVLMAGAQPSATRAAIMFMLVALGAMFRKHSNPLNELLATCFIMLAAQPFWLYSVGFQLSFTAVLSIILFYPSILARIPGSNLTTHKSIVWLINLLRQSIAVSIAAEILIAPLCIYYFNHFPISFLLSNVLAALFAFLVQLLGIALLAFSGLPTIAHGIARTLDVITNTCSSLLHHLSQFTHLSISQLTISAPQLLLVYIIITATTLRRHHGIRQATYIAGGGLVLLGLLIGIDWHRTQQQQRLVVYNCYKSSYAEWMEGNNYTPIGIPPPNNYAITPAHIYWHLTHNKSFVSNIPFNVNNKIVSIIDSTNATSQLHTQSIIWVVMHDIDWSLLPTHSKLQTIVAAGGCTKQWAQQLQEQINPLGINLHYVIAQGAYILQ